MVKRGGPLRAQHYIYIANNVFQSPRWILLLGHFLFFEHFLVIAWSLVPGK